MTGELLGTLAAVAIAFSVVCSVALIVAAVVGPQAYRNGRAQGRRDIVDLAARQRHLNAVPRRVGR